MTAIEQRDISPAEESMCGSGNCEGVTAQLSGMPSVAYCVNGMAASCHCKMKTDKLQQDKHQ